MRAFVWSIAIFSLNLAGMICALSSCPSTFSSVSVGINTNATITSGSPLLSEVGFGADLVAGLPVHWLRLRGVGGVVGFTSDNPGSIDPGTGEYRGVRVGVFSGPSCSQYLAGSATSGGSSFGGASLYTEPDQLYYIAVTPFDNSSSLPATIEFSFSCLSDNCACSNCPTGNLTHLTLVNGSCSCVRGYYEGCGVDGNYSCMCDSFRSQVTAMDSSGFDACFQCPAFEARHPEPGTASVQIGGCLCNGRASVFYNETDYNIYCPCNGPYMSRSEDLLGTFYCLECPVNASSPDPNLRWDSVARQCSCINGYKRVPDIQLSLAFSCECSEAQYGVAIAGKCGICPVEEARAIDAGVVVDPNAVYVSSCGCRPGYRLAFNSTTNSVFCEQFCFGEPLFVSNGSCFQCATSASVGIPVSPYASYNATDSSCTCLNRFSLDTLIGFGDCSCNGPRAFEADNLCWECPNIPSLNYSSGSCSCISHYRRVLDNATADGVSCVCDGATQFEESGTCFTCPVAGSPVPVQTNADWDGSSCTCLNSFTRTPNLNTGVIDCLCSANFSFVSSGPTQFCSLCPVPDSGAQVDPNAVFVDGSCRCMNGFSLKVDGFGIASCVCDGPTQYLSDGKCFTCAAAASSLSVIDPNAEFSAGTCSCRNLFTLQESMENFQSRCICNANFQYQRNGTCMTCGFGDLGTQFDFRRRQCVCFAGFALSENVSTGEARCLCNGTSQYVKSGSCYTCPTADSAVAVVDPYARFSSGICSCNDTAVLLTEPPNSLVATCSCQNPFNFNSGPSGCFICPATGAPVAVDPNVVYSPSTRSCSCLNQRRLVLNTTTRVASCRCDGTGDFFNAGGNCRTCPISGSAAVFDGRATFVSGVCGCQDGYRLVDVNGALRCSCSETYQFFFNGTCRDCPDRNSMSSFRSFKAVWTPGSPSSEPTCRCLDGYNFEIDSNGQPRCTCSGNGRFPKSGVCYTCPVAGTGRPVDPRASYDNQNTDCLCSNGFSLVTNNNDLSASCECRGPFKFVHNGVCYTCPVATVNGQCGCFGNQQLIFDSFTKTATCGCDSSARKFLQRNFCVTCPETRWNALERSCNCPVNTVVGSVGSTLACIPCNNPWQFFDNGICTECAGDPEIRGVFNTLRTGCVCPAGATGIVNSVVNTCQRTDSCAAANNGTCNSCLAISTSCHWCPSTKRCSSAFNAGFDCEKSCAVPPSPPPSDCSSSTNCTSCTARSGCTFISEKGIGGRCVPTANVSRISYTLAFTSAQQCASQCSYYKTCSHCAASSVAYGCEWCSVLAKCQLATERCMVPGNPNELAISKDFTCNKIDRRFVWADTVSEDEFQTNVQVRVAFDFIGFGGVRLRRSVSAVVKHVETGAINATIVLGAATVIYVPIVPDRSYQIQYIQAILGIFAMPKIPYHSVTFEMKLTPVDFMPENYVPNGAYTAQPPPLYAVNTPPNAIITRVMPEPIEIGKTYRNFMVFLEYSGALRTVDQISVSWAGRSKAFTRSGTQLVFDLDSSDTATCSHNVLLIEIEFTDQDGRKIFRSITRKVQIYDLTFIRQDTFLGSNLTYGADGSISSGYLLEFTNQQSPTNPLSWTSGAVEFSLRFGASFELSFRTQKAQANLDVSGRVVIAEKFLIAGGLKGNFFFDNSQCKPQISQVDVGGFLELGYIWSIKPPFLNSLPKQISDMVRLELAVIVGIQTKFTLFPERSWTSSCKWQLGSLKVCPPAEIAPYLRAQATIGVGDTWLGGEITIQAKFAIRVVFDPKARLGSIGIGLTGTLNGYLAGLEYKVTGTFTYCFYQAEGVSCTVDKRYALADSTPVFQLGAKNSTLRARVAVASSFLEKQDEYIYLDSAADSNSGPKIAFDGQDQALLLWSVRPVSDGSPLPAKLKLATFRNLGSTSSSVTRAVEDFPLHNASCVDTSPIVGPIPGEPETFMAVWIRSCTSDEYASSPLDGSGNALLSSASQVRILNSSRLVYAIKYPEPLGWSSVKEYTVSRTSSAPVLSDLRTPHPTVQPVMMVFQYFDVEQDGDFFVSNNFGLYASLWNPLTSSFSIESADPLIALPGIAKDISITSYHNFHLLIYSFTRPDATYQSQFLLVRWADPLLDTPEIIVPPTPLVADVSIIETCNETIGKPFSFALSTAAADSSVLEPTNGTLKFIIGFTCQRTNIFLGSVDPFDGAYSVLTTPAVRSGRVSVVSASKSSSGTVLSWHEKPELKEILDIEPSYNLAVLNETAGIPSLQSIAETLSTSSKRFARGTYDESDFMSVVYGDGRNMLVSSIERSISPTPITYEDGTQGDEVVGWSVMGSMFDIRTRAPDVPLEVTCSRGSARVSGPNVLFDITCESNRQSPSVEFTLSAGEYSGSENLILARASSPVAAPGSSVVVTLSVSLLELTFGNIRITTNTVGRPFRFNVDTSVPDFSFDADITRVNGVSGSVKVVLGIQNAAIASLDAVIARVYAASLNGVALGSNGLGQLLVDEVITASDIRVGKTRETQFWVSTLYSPGVYTFRMELYSSPTATRALATFDVANVTIFGADNHILLPCHISMSSSSASVTGLGNIPSGSVLAVFSNSSLVATSVISSPNLTIALSGSFDAENLRFLAYSEFGSVPPELLLSSGSATPPRPSALCPSDVSLLPLDTPILHTFSFSGKRGIQSVAEAFFAVRLGQLISSNQAVIVTSNDTGANMLLNELGHQSIGSANYGKLSFASSGKAFVVFSPKTQLISDILFLTVQLESNGSTPRDVSFSATVVDVVSLGAGATTSILSPGAPTLFTIAAESVSSPFISFTVDSAATSSIVTVSRSSFSPSSVPFGSTSSVLVSQYRNFTVSSIRNTTDSSGNLVSQVVEDSFQNTTWTYIPSTVGVFFFSFFPGPELSLATPVRISVSGIQVETSPSSCPVAAVIVNAAFSPARGAFMVVTAVPNSGNLSSFDFRLSDDSRQCAFSSQRIETSDFEVLSLTRAGNCPGATYRRPVALSELSRCFPFNGARFASVPRWQTSFLRGSTLTAGAFQIANETGQEISFTLAPSHFLPRDIFNSASSNSPALVQITPTALRISRNGVISASAQLYISVQAKKEFMLSTTDASTTVDPCSSPSVDSDCRQIVRHNFTIAADSCSISRSVQVPLVVNCRTGVSCSVAETGSVTITVSIDTTTSLGGLCSVLAVQNATAVVVSHSSSAAPSIDISSASSVSFSGVFAHQLPSTTVTSVTVRALHLVQGNVFFPLIARVDYNAVENDTSALLNRAGSCATADTACFSINLSPGSTLASVRAGEYRLEFVADVAVSSADGAFTSAVAVSFPTTFVKLPSVASTPSQGTGSSGLSGGAIAGIVIAVIVAVIAAAVLAFFFLRRRKATREAAKKAASSFRLKQKDSSSSSSSEDSEKPVQARPSPAAEMSSSSSSSSSQAPETSQSSSSASASDPDDESSEGSSIEPSETDLSSSRESEASETPSDSDSSDQSSS